MTSFSPHLCYPRLVTQPQWVSVSYSVKQSNRYFVMRFKALNRAPNIVDGKKRSYFFFFSDWERPNILFSYLYGLIQNFIWHFGFWSLLLPVFNVSKWSEPSVFLCIFLMMFMTTVLQRKEVKMWLSWYWSCLFNKDLQWHIQVVHWSSLHRGNIKFPNGSLSVTGCPVPGFFSTPDWGLTITRHRVGSGLGKVLELLC